MDTRGMPPPLRNRLAAEFSGNSSEFEHQLLLRCMSPWKRPLAHLILALSPKTLKPDLEVMRDAGDTWNLDQVKSLVVELKKPRSGWSLIRDGLKVRASGRRLVHVAAHVPGFAGASPGPVMAVEVTPPAAS